MFANHSSDKDLNAEYEVNCQNPTAPNKTTQSENGQVTRADIFTEENALMENTDMKRC